MNNKDLLPVGSIATFKGSDKKMMIIGFGAVGDKDPNVVYDYYACMYPEGIMDVEETVYAFNRKDVKKIFYTGYMDDENKGFLEKMDKVIEEYLSKKGETTN